jgi:predicted nuclease of restriction endonuclease-like (RecB) superfamily
MTRRQPTSAPDFDLLVGRISAASDALRREAVASVNRAVTARAWLTGYYIVEYEQHGRDRAKYGERLLRQLAERLSSPGFALANLKNDKAFYLAYPSLSRPVATYLAELAAKGQSVSGLLPEALSAPLLGKGQTASGLLLPASSAGGKPSIPEISPDALFSCLPFSHIVELLRLPDPLQRTFYAFSAIRGTWSVRELRRQIESRCYERSGWSRDPAKLAALTDARAEKETALGTLRSPHVFEFLGLAAKDVWEESDLEQAIVDHLQAFILEMGLGFCFEARQKKILIDGRYHKIDLVFYHRILKCHVLVELKAKRFDARDAAQLSVYMAHYRKHEMAPDDNPPVGILLCTEVGAETAEYVSTFVEPGLFVSKYEVQLPDRRRIADFLKRENAALASVPVPPEGGAE